MGDQAIRVSSNLPPGYLQHEQLGLGKGVSTCTKGEGIWLTGALSWCSISGCIIR